MRDQASDGGAVRWNGVDWSGAALAEASPPAPADAGAGLGLRRYVIGVLFTLPLLAGLVGRLVHGGRWFADYGAVVCGAIRAAAGEPLYPAAGQCPDPHGAAFIYTPPIADAAAAARHLLGPGGFAVGYAAAYVAAVLAMMWVTQRRPATPGVGDLAPLPLAFVTGSGLVNGNIAVILHGAVAVTALWFSRAPWLFVAATAAAGAVKPILLTYLAVPVLALRSWRARLAAVAAGAVAGLAPTVWFLERGAGESAAWRALLGRFVYHVTPGYGLFGWLQTLGINGSGLLGGALALAFAGALCLALLRVADRAELGAEDRVWLGLTCAVLVNPRLMSQDFLLLGPGIWVMADAVARWNPRLGRLLRVAAITACVLALIAALADWLAGVRLATFVLSALAAISGLDAMARAPSPALELELGRSELPVSYPRHSDR